jgi:putative transposase
MSIFIPRGRHSIRLKGYDYSQSGLYDITICTHGRLCIFGEIEKEKMIPNRLGLMVDENWRNIPGHWPDVELIEYGVMPNHLHGIIVIKEKRREKLGTEGRMMGTTSCAPTDKIEGFGRSTSGSIPTIIKLFKGGVTMQVGISPMRELYGNIWQKGYFEHIIRSEEELQARIKYIRDNPKNWDKDPYYKR